MSRTAYKFTNPDRSALWGIDDYPPIGTWSTNRIPRICSSGWHIPADHALGLWVAPELWEVEVDGVSESDGEKSAHQRIRFVRQIKEWKPEHVLDFAKFCIDRLENRFDYFAKVARNQYATATHTREPDALVIRSSYVRAVAENTARSRTLGNHTMKVTELAAQTDWILRTIGKTNDKTEGEKPVRKWKVVIHRLQEAEIEVEIDNKDDRDALVLGRIQQGRVSWRDGTPSITRVTEQA